MRSFDYASLEKIQWDNDIVLMLSQIHECKGRQELFLRQRPATLDRMVELAKVQSTESSNKIEGIMTTSARVRELIAEKVTPRNRDEQEIAGYRDVLNLIHERYEYIPLRSSVILQLHRDLYRFSGSGIGGHYKNTQNYISAKTADGKEYILFTPLPPYETPEAMETICSQYALAIDRGAVDSLYQGFSVHPSVQRRQRPDEPPADHPAALSERLLRGQIHQSGAYHRKNEGYLL